MRAEGCRSAHEPHIIPRHARQRSLLITIHSRFGGFHIMRGPRFDFNKAEHIFFPPNEVNLASSQRRAKISRHHYISQPSQMKVGILFSASPRMLMARSGLRRKRVCSQPIECP
jgi:hypothetical protein